MIFKHPYYHKLWSTENHFRFKIFAVFSDYFAVKDFEAISTRPYRQCKVTLVKSDLR